ncbi:MAG: hypothetical protein A2Y62_15755 [Candidatus Fischerbacteria bacterium RBG_13_37_8]|uniref:Uncharacterized protein n=1 Tax=Candidatus Fischerbacteria bacterium RBG_13_37_8 TaxID=1817863 RepID=A0A1F5VVW2_9BACT|nr:MAG: hypothetical protein A2Y62_15755 [Candidatus Fischerbacteria bacterium RBG_13_37_8]
MGVDGRYNHKAVWTGTEMIVWGGESGAVHVDTGGRYNPVTDTWVPTSLDNAAIARGRYSAVWTNSEMIIWAGITEPFFSSDTGGRYCLVEPYYLLECDPSVLNILRGTSEATSSTITSINNFSSPVTLSCEGLPTGISCDFTPNPVTPPPNDSISSTLTVTVASAVQPGEYMFYVNATDGTLIRKVKMKIIVTYILLQQYLLIKPEIDDSGSNTENGIIETDEPVLLIGHLQNSGTADSVNTVGILSTSDPVVIIQNTATYGTIMAGSDIYMQVYECVYSRFLRYSRLPGSFF